jgi:hypothetical protein
MMKHTAHDRNLNRLRAWGIPLGIGLLFLTLYLTFQSASFDDFDSYSFALALDNFDLKLQQPQPPGFPVYVALARLCRLTTSGHLEALTLLSAASGATAAVLVYALGRRSAPRHPMAAGLAALFFGLTPVSWLTAEKALSDMPGLAWTLLALRLWVEWNSPSTGMRYTMRRWILPIAVGLVTGLSLGVRPQNALPILLFVVGLFFDDLRHRRPSGRWLAAIGGGLIGIALWLLPTVTGVGGIQGYAAIVLKHAGHVGRSDAILGMSETFTEALRSRAYAFGDVLMTSLIARGLYPPLQQQTVMRLVIMTAFVALGLLKTDWRHAETRWLGLWVLATALQIFVFETLDRPRLLLPLVPPLSLLVASGWARLKMSGFWASSLIASAATMLLLQTLPLAAQLSQTAAPPARAATYVSERYDPEETLIAAAGSFRAVQVELPNYPKAYLYQFDPAVVDMSIEEGRSFIVIFDRDQFPAETMDVLSRQGTWVTVEDRTFSRERSIHTQHDQVRIQVLAPPEQVPPEALKLPDDGCVDLGSGDDGRYLGAGWFRPEEIGGVLGRWAGQTLTSTLRLRPSRDRDYEIYLQVMAYPPDQQVTVRIDGVTVGSAPLPRSWGEVRLALPQEARPKGETMVLSLHHLTSASPYETTTGGSSDRRQLTAAYDRICLLPGTTANATLTHQSGP